MPIGTKDVRSPQTALPILVRMAGDNRPDGVALTRRLNELFPRNVIHVESIESQSAHWLEGPRFVSILTGLLGGVALWLAGVGLYAIVSFEARRRRYEMTIRLAIGATAGQIRRRLLEMAVVPMSVGILIGAVSLRVGASVVNEILPNTPIATPFVLVVSALVLMVVGCAATWGPSRMGSTINIAEGLKVR